MALSRVKQSSGFVKYGDSRATGVSYKYREKQSQYISETLLDEAKIVKRGDSFFKIEYQIPNDNGKYTNQNIVFDLMPAVEAPLSLNASGNIRGGNSQVPEVKPGIPVTTSKRVSVKPIPGGISIIQTIGIEHRVLQLVGALTGKETSTLQGSKGLRNTYNEVKVIEQYLIEQGVEVKITLKFASGNAQQDAELVYEGVIKDFKVYMQRQDRTYYAMTFLVTNYASQEGIKEIEKVTPKEESESTDNEESKDTKSKTKSNDLTSTQRELYDMAISELNDWGGLIKHYSTGSNDQKRALEALKNDNATIGGQTYKDYISSQKAKPAAPTNTPSPSPSATPNTSNKVDTVSNLTPIQREFYVVLNKFYRNSDTTEAEKGIRNFYKTQGKDITDEDRKTVYAVLYRANKLKDIYKNRGLTESQLQKRIQELKDEGYLNPNE